MECTCGHPKDQHSAMAGCFTASPRPGVPYCPCDTYTPAVPDISEPTPTRTETLAQGRAARDDGIEQAGTGAPGVLVEAWRAKAADAMDVLIVAGGRFTADDVVDRAGMPPVPNMLGGLFTAARKAGRIQPMGYTQATRAASHARIQRVWQAK